MDYDTWRQWCDEDCGPCHYYAECYREIGAGMALIFVLVVIPLLAVVDACRWMKGKVSAWS